MENIKTRCVKNKNIMLALCQQGYTLLNVTTNRDNGKPAYIFHNTPEFAKAFQTILDNREKHSDKVVLTDFERQFVKDILVQKRDEYRKMGIQNTDTLDGCIDKLKGNEKVDSAGTATGSDLDKIRGTIKGVTLKDSITWDGITKLPVVNFAVPKMQNPKFNR